MNRSELVESVAANAGLDKAQADKAVKAVVDTVMQESKAGAKVSIFGFGAFTPTSRAARVGRNPQTGEAVNIAASNGVKFTASTAFKALLNPRTTTAKKRSKAGGTKATASKATASTTGAAKKTAAAKKTTAATKAATTKKSAPVNKVVSEKVSKPAKKAAKASKKK